MFLKIFMGFLFLIIVAAETFAAGPGTLSLERFVTVIAKKTGQPAEEVRERAIESLRESGNFSNEDLERVRQHSETSFSPAKANEMVRLLQKSATFRVSTGLESIRIEAIQNDAGNAFNQLAERNELEVVELKAQVIKTTIRALEAKIARGDHIADATAQLKRVKTDLGSTTSELYFAATKYLAQYHIPFHAVLVDGRPMLQIEALSASSAIQRQLELETHSALGPDQIVRRPTIMIDPANMNEATVYDSTRSTIFLGNEFLQRIK